MSGNNVELPDDIILPSPTDQKEEDLYNTLSDYFRGLSSAVKAIPEVEANTDEVVKAAATDPTAGYLDAKVDDSTIEVASNALKVKDSGIVTIKIADGAVTTIKLDGGTASPGMSKYYGTNAAGTKGFYDTKTSTIIDDDGDTKVQVEESADEDIIRFDAAGVQEAQIDANGLTLKTGTSVNELSTDGTLAGNSDNALPTEKAVKTYVDGSSGSLPTLFSFGSGGDYSASKYGYIAERSADDPGFAELTRGPCWMIGDQTGYGILLRTKFMMLSTISNVVVYVRGWEQGSWAGPHFKCDVGGQSQTLSFSGATPAWYTLTAINVTSLSPDTVYDVTISMRSDNGTGQKSLFDSVIGFAT